MTVYLEDLKSPAESKLSNAKLWVLFIGLDVWQRLAGVGTIAVSYRITKCRVSRVSKSSQDIPLPVTTGLFEIEIFVSWSFPQSYHSHSWVRQTYLHSLELPEFSFTMSSYLVSTKSLWKGNTSYLDLAIDINWSGHVHDREFSYDGFNRVQNLQGSIPASQAYIRRAKVGSYCQWWETNLFYHGHNDRVRYDFVFYPTCSVRGYCGWDKRCRISTPFRLSFLSTKSLLWL